MTKRILAILFVSTLLLTSFTACGKDKEDTPESTPTPVVSEDSPEGITPSVDNTENAGETILFGGYFTRDNALLSIGLLDGTWKVSGYLFRDNEDTSPLLLSGSLSLTNNTDFVFTDADNELTFTFAVDSVTVKVNKGTAYSEFAGTYDRVDQATPDAEIITPENGSALEQLGRIALTHYMINVDGLTECSIDVTALEFDSDYMEDFLLSYADLFLVDKAEPLPEVSDKYLCYTFTKEGLDDLFSAVTAGTFTTAQFNITDSGIVSKDGNYYIPCQGAISGGLTSSSETQEPVSDALTLGGVVAKADGTRYDLTMTLSTKANSASGSAGVQITSVNYKLVK